MPLGGRPSTARSRRHFDTVAVVTAGVPPTPVSIIDPEPRVEYRHETIYATLEQVPLLGNQEHLVATLAAPPAEQSFVIERLAISNTPNAAAVLLSGGPLVVGNIRDQITAPTLDVLVTADAQPIRLLPLQPLKILWIAAPEGASYFANLQIRVEEL